VVYRWCGEYAEHKAYIVMVVPQGNMHSVGGGQAARGQREEPQVRVVLKVVQWHPAGRQAKAAGQ